MSDAAKALFYPFERGILPQPLAGRCFFLRAESPPALVREWQPPLICEQSFKPAYDSLRNAGCSVERELTGDGFDLGLCLLTKHRSENLATLGRAWSALRPGGTLVCAGGKDVGVASVERAFKAVVGELLSLSKYHCKVFWTTRGDDMPATLSDWVQAARLQIAPETGCWSRPGVYNWNKVDAGSALLAENLPDDLTGRVADLGAGWGYLSLQILKRCAGIAALDLFEAEWHALEAAKANLDHAAPSARLAFHWHDVATGLPEAAFHAVVMNPPFHDGKAVDITLGCSFITAAARSLAPGGKLMFVANRQLPYEATVGAHFRSFQTMAETPLYKVIFAVR